MVLDGCVCCPGPEGLPFLTFPAASARPPTLPAEAGLAPFFRLFSIFFACKKTHDFRLLKKLLFLAILAIFCASGVEFRRFWVPKRVPGGYFFGVFSKTVILSKSCSRCGGSTVLEGQTLRKSVRRANPNGNGKKNRQKSLLDFRTRSQP